jgi:hypothetical protein
MTIADVVAKEFAEMWEMFREVVEKFPGEQWEVRDGDRQSPARLAYHAIEGVDRYARATPEGHSPVSRFGEYREAKPEHPATKKQVLIHLNEVRTQVETWLNGMRDSDLLSFDSGFPQWESVLERALGQLRHVQHHLGQLNAELGRRGLPTAEWR